MSWRLTSQAVPLIPESNRSCFVERFAILGGTFNPIHWGHLLIAETALNQVQLDRIIWVPAYHPPHKSEPAMLLNFEHRYEMVQRAIAQHPNFEVSAIERTQSGNSYAIKTLQALQALYPGRQWYWIIGLDAFRSLPHWYGCRALLERCCWLVAPRFDPAQSPGRKLIADSIPEKVCFEVERNLAAQSITVCWQILEMPLVEISSSLVRRYCQENRSIRDLVPAAVRDYILTQKLYQSSEI